MKKIINIILLVLLFFVSCTLYFQYDYSNSLKEQISKRDTIITYYQSLDSIYKSTLKQYVDTVEKYITPEFVYGEKRISTEELLEITNKTMEEYNTCRYELIVARDSIRMYRDYYDRTQRVLGNMQKHIDSSFIYKNYTQIAKEKYGINFSYKNKGNEYLFMVESRKIDSALILLPFFRDRIKYNPQKKSWQITTRKGLFK